VDLKIRVEKSALFDFLVEKVPFSALFRPFSTIKNGKCWHLFDPTIRQLHSPGVSDVGPKKITVLTSAENGCGADVNN
jgi:hypothetical protein